MNKNEGHSSSVRFVVGMYGVYYYLSSCLFPNTDFSPQGPGGWIGRWSSTCPISKGGPISSRYKCPQEDFRCHCTYSINTVAFAHKNSTTKTGAVDVLVDYAGKIM